MFAWWGRVVTRFRWAVLAVAVAVVVIGGTWGAGVFDSLSDGGFYNPDSPSQQAEQKIVDEFGRQAVDVVVLYESDAADVNDPEFTAAVTDILDDVRARADVESVASYYDTGSPAFVSDDGRATYAAITLTGEDDAERSEQYTALKPYLDADGLTTSVGGFSAIFDDVNTQTQQDIITVEMFTLPILLLLMIVIFGSLVAAMMPLLIGVIAIMGGFIITRLLTQVTDVSVFAINVITIIGLGLAIDYALFVVSRFREELAVGRAIEDVVVRTMTTAGRTVMVSGLTIVIALAGLLLFPLPFLHGIAYGGMSAVGVAMLGSMSVLPALLAVLGTRVDAVRMPWRRRDAARGLDENGFWARVGRAVMKRPVMFMVLSVAVLVGLATPFLHASFGAVDETVLPTGTESRVVSERLKEEFPGGDQNSLDVLVTGTDEATTKEFVADIEAMEHVDSVLPIAASDDAAVLRVGFDVEPHSSHARELATDISGLEAAGTQVAVTGMPAHLNDQFSDISERLPWLALYVCLVTLILLFLAFGSVLLPIKAVLMNIISIGASFGVVVWIFQDGHFAELLGFTPTGYLEPSNLLLMVVLLFGLSTDYEVFLLSRVREEWDRTHDNTTAVLTGLQRTGGIISSAALLLIVVVAGFAAGGIMFLKMIGVGMAVAIFIDATLVRMLLVPATMRVMGRANWWAPAFLRRFYARYGVKEGGPELPAAKGDHVGASR